MERQKKLGNEGFSLVELLVVVAIMAVLVGVITPQLLGYVERSKEVKDAQVLDTVRTAVVTAMLDPNVADVPAEITDTKLSALSDGDFKKAIFTITGCATEDQIKEQLSSKNASDSYDGIKITATKDGKVTVTAGKVTVGELKSTADSGTGTGTGTGTGAVSD